MKGILSEELDLINFAPGKTPVFTFSCEPETTD